MSINLSSEQYGILLEMFQIIADLDFYDETDTPEDFKAFDSLWDAVLAAKSIEAVQ